ncbi:MAG: hypothetical protein ABIF11_01210 [Nitrospirota bacterium]
MDWTILIIFALSSFITMLGVLIGGWLVFKSKSSVPNETFLGKAPKGEVFSITDGLDEAPFPEEPSKDEKKILERTNKFLKSLGG